GLEATGEVNEATSLLLDKGAASRRNAPSPATDAGALVPMAEASAPPTGADHYVVHGQVRYASGAPAKGRLVRAYDKALRSEQFLNEMLSKGGIYSIAYDSSKFLLAEAGSADLRISVCTADGREIASSPIRFNAKADETIDVILPASLGGPSEYD